MTRERKLIAAQVVVSALALLVIYLTVLAPDGDGPLEGVQAPGDGIHREANGKKQAGAQGKKRGAGKGRRDDRRGRAQGPGLRAGVTGPGLVDQAASPDDLAARQGPRRDGPTADQYDDTLSRITARVASG